MKKLFQYFTLALFGFPMVIQAQIGLKLGSQPGTKQASAILDLTGTTNQGLLIPRVNLTSTTSYAPLTGAAQAGMLVYNQATAGTAPNNVTPGFYYHNGTVWVRTAGTNDTSEAWTLKGNTATNPATDFLGTTDANRLILKTNNKTAITASENGTVTIGSDNLLAEYPTATHKNPLFRVNQGNVEIFKNNPGSYDAVTRSYISVDSTHDHFAARAISGSFAAGQGLNSAKTGYENKAWAGVSNFVTVIQAEGDNYTTNFSGRVDNLIGFNTDLGFWASNPNGVVRNATGLSVNANAKGALDNFLHQSHGAVVTSRASGGNVGANAFGFRVSAAQATSTGVNNAYGLFVNNVSASGGTTNNAWSIYSQTTAPSFFNGNLGIGTVAPNAPLQFANSTANRKIVLWQSNNNDHQYFGFGLNNGVLRYQVNAITDRHTFFAGIDDATSTELMTIRGNGNVGIGTVNPSHNLHVNSTTGEAVIRLSATGSNLLRQFSGGIDGAARFSIGSGLSPDRIVLHSNGLLGIGTLDPETVLHVNGQIRSRSASTNGFVTLESGNATQAGFIRFSNPNGSSNGYIGWTPNMMNYVSENGAHHVFSNGNVGIGTTAPSTQLHTTGGVRFQGLTGVGTRMVISDANGVLSTQAIPVSNTYTGSTSIALNGTSFERAALSGDVTAAANVNTVTVTGLQGRGVVSTAPTSGQALAWNGSAWAPTTISTSSQNIYNTDGALTGPRNVNKNGQTLTFSGGGNIQFNGGNVMNVADNASFTWDALGGTSLGFVKKVGFGPMIASGSNGPIVFATSGNNLGDVGGASFSERMRVTEIGRVGIGTNNPTTILQVNGGSILSTSGSNSGVSELIAGDPGYNINNFTGAIVRQYGVDNTGNLAGVALGGAAAFLGQNNNRTIYGSNQNVNTFFISGDQIDMTIDGGNGRVGVGTATPTHRMSVVGGIKSFQNGRYTEGYLGQGSYLTWNDEGLSGAPELGYTTLVNNRGTGSPGGFIFSRTINDGVSFIELMRIRGDNGFTGLGTSTPNHPLQMGSGAHVTTAGVWTNASDKRLKTNITDSRYGLKDVLSLRPVDYVMKQDGSQQVGLVAQEVLNVIPEVVSGKEGDPDKGEILGISYGNLVPVLVKAIQEQQVQINQLKKQIELLKSNR